MKRWILWLTLAGFAVSLCGCKQEAPQNTVQTQPVTTEETVDFLVPDPMEYPDYTFDHTPTTDELRQMAVKAMLDQLSVQFSVGRFTYYQKSSGSVSNKFFSYVPEVIYAGMPYTIGSSGLVQWMEYYDTETGRFTFNGTGEELDKTLGNSCAACVGSSWYAVCTSIGGSFATYFMTPTNGCIPVGPYVSNYTITDYRQYTTDLICADNGEQVMYESYAAILPADALVSSPDVHAIMAIEKAHVVYNEDGTINGNESTVTIADQRAGDGDLFYILEDEQGNQVSYSGRVRYDYTFTELWNLSYIPVTTAEFMGTKEYVQPTVTFTESAGSKQELLSGTVESNYPMRVIRTVLVDQDGVRMVVDRMLLNNTHVPSGRAYSINTLELNMALTDAVLSSYMEEGKTYSLCLEVAIANGRNFTVARADGLSK